MTESCALLVVLLLPEKLNHLWEAFSHRDKDFK